jgi:O-antigen ligase
VGLVGAFGIYLVMLFRIKFKLVFLVSVGLIAFFFAFQTQIFMMLEQNNQDSSDNFSEQIESMSNISTDASNLERINRWNSALRMFEEKPVFGFGPATYMFQYAPYQFSYEKTIISTNSGDGGNAHSEYLGPLAESGLLGSLSFILIIILTSYSAIKIYSYDRSYEIRLLAMVIFLGLVTYYIHGVLNNFLDIDKTSALFWGFSSIIVALDVFHHQRKQEKSE